MNRKKFLNKISKWPWGVIVANLLTFATLWYSIYQNNENENENNLELKRIRLRDSVQTYRDSVKTDILKNELLNQLSKNRIDHTKDSVQLALFNSQIVLLNKSLLTQNKGIEIQNSALNADLLAKQSQLVLKVGFQVREGNKDSPSPVLSYSLTNVGNSIAQNIISNYFITSIDNTAGIVKYNSQNISCFKGADNAYSNVLIKSGETVAMGALMSINIPLVKQNSYDNMKKKKMDDIYDRYMKERNFQQMSNEITAFNEKYPIQVFSKFAVIKISYTDKYKNMPNEVYTVIKINYHFDQGDLTVYAMNANFSDFPSLLKCIKDSGFNAEQIKEQIRRSNSKSENSTYFQDHTSIYILPRRFIHAD